ncbi:MULTISPECIES: EbsA family protein [unclassified Enterococcus]|jgi:hypothetical protein|uniref:EbsA family protein n=1 Tax=unclassified Enterococcus TaxID=2608891 RepID=UPI0003527ECD|nr:hypothetical protein D920_02421 [Enterococcus faecalis 13-SD-W-01]
MKKTIRWQPEPAQLIIYWSFTFIILFASLIMALENTRPYWGSNLVLGAFFFLFLIGSRRGGRFTAEGLKIYRLFFWKDRFFPFETIEKLVFSNKQLKIFVAGETTPQVYVPIWRKKTKEKMIGELRASAYADKIKCLSEKTDA